MGLGSALFFSSAPSPQRRVWLRVDTRTWSGSALPTVLLEVDSGASLAAGRALLLSPSLGMLSTSGSDGEIWRAGAPPEGSQRARLVASRHLFLRVTLQGELAAEQDIGEGWEPRLRAGLGASARLPALRERAPAGQAALTTFTLDAPGADDVRIAGSWSGWQPQPLQREPDGTWRAEIRLAPGLYEHTCLVDGRPMAPPEAEVTREDGFGGQNGVLVVR